VRKQSAKLFAQDGNGGASSLSGSAACSSMSRGILSTADTGGGSASQVTVIAAGTLPTTLPASAAIIQREEISAITFTCSARLGNHAARFAIGCTVMLSWHNLAPLWRGFF
jgi:hypothetical protein